MSPAERAQQIADAHLADAPQGARDALAEEIRWAIVRGQIEARQPPEVELTKAPAIVQQVVGFVDYWLVRMRGASYAEQANALQACRTRVLAAHAIPVAAEGLRKPIAKTECVWR